jgi:hypothetical protein
MENTNFVKLHADPSISSRGRSWTEQPRNSEFMKNYYERGTPVTIDGLEHPALNIQTLNPEVVQKW